MARWGSYGMGTRVLKGQPIEARALLETEQLRWSVLKVRDTARGELWIRFAALQVYRLEDELPENVFRAMLTVNGGEQIESTGDGWRLLADGRMRQESGINAETQR